MSEVSDRGFVERRSDLKTQCVERVNDSAFDAELNSELSSVNIKRYTRSVNKVVTRGKATSAQSAGQRAGN